MGSFPLSGYIFNGGEKGEKNGKRSRPSILKGNILHRLLFGTWQSQGEEENEQSVVSRHVGAGKCEGKNSEMAHLAGGFTCRGLLSLPPRARRGHGLWFANKSTHLAAESQPCDAYSLVPQVVQSRIRLWKACF